MKTIIKILFLCFANIVMLTSCNDDVMSDDSLWKDSILENINAFAFTIVDKDSVNILLNDSIRESYIKNVSIVYNDKRYTCDYIFNFNVTENFPTITKNTHSLSMVYCISKENHPLASFAYMSFGGFRGGNYENETFFINWGDGTCDTISFTHSLKYSSKNNKPIKKSEFYLNDVKQEGNDFIIVK